MVFPDLSAPTVHKKTVKERFQQVAPVSDRAVALVLDFLIFSPIISLFISGLVRHSKTSFFLNPLSDEGIVALALASVMVFFLTVISQTVFLYFWQATPGQLFLQLRVISFPEPKGRLSFNQCAIRAFFWCFNFLLLGIPFVEVLSHSKRRAFHERSSDTMVITLRNGAQDTPHSIETRFISSWARIAFMMLISIGVVSFFKIYHGLFAGHFKAGTQRSVVSSCKVDTLSLDTVMAMYLADGLSEACLNEKAEKVLWSAWTDQVPMAYLARYLVTDGEERDRYFEKICESQESFACRIAGFMESSTDDLEAMENLAPVSSVVKVLLIDKKMDQQDYVSSLRLIEQLKALDDFEELLDKKYVRAAWSLQEQLNTISNRRPATYEKANEDAEDLLHEFRERYEIQ